MPLKSCQKWTKEQVFQPLCFRVLLLMVQKSGKPVEGKVLFCHNLQGIIIHLRWLGMGFPPSTVPLTNQKVSPDSLGLDLYYVHWANSRGLKFESQKTTKKQPFLGWNFTSLEGLGGQITFRNLKFSVICMGNSLAKRGPLGGLFAL